MNTRETVIMSGHAFDRFLNSIPANGRIERIGTSTVNVYAKRKSTGVEERVFVCTLTNDGWHVDAPKGAIRRV